MLFFNLKTSEKLIFSLFTGAVLFASCSGPKKVAVSDNTKNTSEKVTKNEHVREDKPTTLHQRQSKMLTTLQKKKESRPTKLRKSSRQRARLLGRPYKYGGMTRSGMDCSGLLINSFTVVKVNLPRSSEAQSKIGTQVKMNDLKPGDLVFFATGNKENEEYAHSWPRYRR